jgi:hypothetical protein
VSELTALNQDFSVNAGDDYTVIFRNFSQNGGKLSLSNFTFKWTIKTPSPLIKTQGNINLNELSIPLVGSETTSLKGNFDHVLEVYDLNNKKSTLAKGVVTFD